MISDPPSKRRDTAPSIGQALLLWLLAAVALLAASTAMSALAVGVQLRRGVDPTRLTDPKFSLLATDPLWIALGTLVNEGAIAIVILGAVWWLGLERAEVLARGRPSLASSAAALLLVFGLAPLANALAELVDAWVRNPISAADVVMAAARGASTLELLLLFVGLAVVPAWVEEALFRGVLFSAFERVSGPLAVIVTSVLFAIFHIDPPQAAGTLLLGVAFGLARLATGGIAVSVLIHAIHNAAVLLLVRFGPSPEGAEVAPGAVVVGLAVAAAGGTWLLRRARPA